VREVATSVALMEGDSGVRAVIGAVRTHEPVSVRRISRAVELPVPIVAAVCAELRKRGVISRSRPVQLTEEGRKLFQYLDHQATTVCPTCDGREFVAPAELETVDQNLSKIARLAPRARFEIDQSHCTVETKIRRVLFMHETGALVGRRVLLLGDDDLMSITIDHLAEHFGMVNTISELVVVDVDDEILAFCRSQLREARFPVTLVNHDLRNPLPADLTARFDTVFTDPPYTPEGAELFLSRAAAALAPSSGGNVFFSFGMKQPQDLLRIQTAMTSMGFVTRRLVRGFNEYLGSGALGGVSNIYHLTSTSQTRALIPGNHSGGLYTGDERRSRRYRCLSCGAIEVVGPDEVRKTVAAMKTHGCSHCGHAFFRPLPRVDRKNQEIRAQDGS
jgi:predicted methyltransferase/DNA-directed RNA polymerase subunit RPC12/RpoP